MNAEVQSYVTEILRLADLYADESTEYEDLVAAASNPQTLVMVQTLQANHALLEKVVSHLPRDVVPMLSLINIPWKQTSATPDVDPHWKGADQLHSPTKTTTTAKSTPPANDTPQGTFLEVLSASLDNSLLRDLERDPQCAANYPNKGMREVHSGHYVLVPPSPLPLPYLVIHSVSMATELGFSDAHCISEDFLRFFSGDVNVATPAPMASALAHLTTTATVPGTSAGHDHRGSNSAAVQTWSTPYALSIYGNFRNNEQCPFRNGCGYGDGRAVSLGEVVSPVSQQRWELQVKGAGRTPFCRGADGRAVLRSSVREFLASEAMHHLGVPTTRALSLVVSRQEAVRRNAPEQNRRALLVEPCAMTCRVAPSFIRVGSIELFGRRIMAERHSMPCFGSGEPTPSEEEATRQLDLLVSHALQREFGGTEAKTLQGRARELLSKTAEAVAGMCAEWIRVGFCQGNFNSDNCLLGGRTMDYGPFGFVEASMTD